MAHTTKDKAKRRPCSQDSRTGGSHRASARRRRGVFQCAANHGCLLGVFERIDGGSAGGSRPVPVHSIRKSGKNSPQAEAAEELIDVIRRYLK